MKELSNLENYLKDLLHFDKDLIIYFDLVDTNLVSYSL